MESLITAAQIRALSSEDRIYTDIVARIKKAAFNNQKHALVEDMPPIIKKQLELDGFTISECINTRYLTWWCVSWEEKK